jgi:hypothetical protein
MGGLRRRVRLVVLVGLAWSSLYLNLPMKLFIGLATCLEQFVQSGGAARLLLCCDEGRGERLSALKYGAGEGFVVFCIAFEWEGRNGLKKVLVK